MAARTPLPTVDTVAQNLRAWRKSATSDQVQEGTDWYPNAGALIARLASESYYSTGEAVTTEFAAGVFAAYSQNATWKANVTMATNYLNGSGARGMRAVLRELDALEEGVHPREAIGALKRPDFWSNLTGDYSRVTCDRWHIRAGFGEERKVSLTPEVHALLTEATRIVADEYGESPAATQAIVWCAIRGTGK